MTLRELTVPNAASSVPMVRAFVKGQLEREIDQDVLYDVLVATSEVAGNAVNHVTGASRGTITTSCALRKGAVVVSISDDGNGFDPETLSDEPPDLMSQGGRGLFLVRSLVDELDIDSGPSGTAVTMLRAVGR